MRATSSEENIKVLTAGLYLRYQEDEWSVSDMMFNVAATVVPIGLLLSALPTGLFTFAVRR